MPTPTRLWTLREECGGRLVGQEDSVWAVFRTHEEVRFRLFRWCLVLDLVFCLLLLNDGCSFMLLM